MTETSSDLGLTREPPIDLRMSHLPGLDGIRGVALVIVLLYHHGVTWMTGGELTVSMFFTLSGFLITRLVVNEWAKSGTISLKNFYDRRIRRLFPASFFVDCFPWFGTAVGILGMDVRHVLFRKLLFTIGRQKLRWTIWIRESSSTLVESLARRTGVFGFPRVVFADAATTLFKASCLALF